MTSVTMLTMPIQCAIRDAFPGLAMVLCRIDWYTLKDVDQDLSQAVKYFLHTNAAAVLCVIN